MAWIEFACQDASYCKCPLCAYRARVAELEARIAKADAELINVQPHIAQLPEYHQSFIDSHLDTALAALRGKGCSCVCVCESCCHHSRGD